MKSYLTSTAAALALVILAVTACAPGPPAPPKASEPTKKVDFPAKGKTITAIVPFAAGGSTDIAARVLLPLMEKELGVPIEVVNRVGAGAQAGLTELAASKADGYTIGAIGLPTAITVYLDPERKPAFGRKDLLPLALQSADPVIMAVLPNAPYKTLTDLIDAAKANPGKIRVATSGILGPGDIGLRLLQDAANVKFAVVNLDGAPAIVTSVLGGHVDAATMGIGNFISQLKSGDVRVIAVMDKEENRFLPGVKTAEAQGYKISMSSDNVIVLPAGVPEEIQRTLGAATKKGILNDDHQKKLADLYQTVRYMDATEVGKYWDDRDAQLKPLVQAARPTK